MKRSILMIVHPVSLLRACLATGSALCIFALPAQASFIIGFDLTDLPSSPTPETAPVTTQPSFVSASDLTRGPGMSGSGLGHSFSSNNYPLSPGSTLADALNDDRYFEVEIDIGNTSVSFLSLDARFRKSATDSVFEAQWQYSFDAFATPGFVVGTYEPSDIFTAGNGGAAPSLDLTGIAGLQDVANETVTFRLYVWGVPVTAATSFAFGRSRTGGTVGQGDFLGNSLEFAVIPEPSTAVLWVALITLPTVLVVRRLKRRDTRQAPSSTEETLQA